MAKSVKAITPAHERRLKRMALAAGGKPGDVPRVPPPDEINTGPRDERGKLKPGEPRSQTDRLADILQTGILKLETDEGTLTFGKLDRDAIINALRTHTLAMGVCQMVCKASMSETRPMRGESLMGWQSGDGVNAHLVRVAASLACEKDKP